MSTHTDIHPPLDDSLRKTAVERLKKRQDFWAHLLVYTLVNGVSLVIWTLTGAGFPWPLILMAAWGIGLIMNAYEVFLRRPIGEDDIEREIERMRGRD